MTIKEVERRTGLPRSVIRYYEKEGLIAPLRSEDNRYRDYSQQDVELLVRIAFLRSLELPIADIARVLAGQARLADVAAAQAHALRDKQRDLGRAAAICARLAQDAPERVEELDVGRYADDVGDYVRERRGGLRHDTAAFARWFAARRTWLPLFALTALLALWAWPRLPEEIPVQWSGTQVSGTAPRLAIFAYPLACLVLRFLLRAPIESRLMAPLGALSGAAADCAVNAGCLMALALEGFTLLYAYGVVRSVTALLAGLALLALALLAALRG